MPFNGNNTLYILITLLLIVNLIFVWYRELMLFRTLMKKVMTLFNLGLLIVAFIIFYCCMHSSTWFIVISSYFLARIIIDFVLVIAILINEEKAYIFIEKLTNKRVPKELSWEKRSRGINKWITYGILFLAIGVVDEFI